MAVLGPSGVASSSAPLAAAVEATGLAWTSTVVRVGAAAATLGALLALVAGVGRTALAMARNGDLPRWLAAVHPRFHVPHRAEVAVAVAVCALVLTVDLREAIGFSAFGVLLYYLVANLAALTQTGEHRIYPRALQVLGMVGCLALAVAVPAGALLGGVAVVVVGLLLPGAPPRTLSRTRTVTPRKVRIRPGPWARQVRPLGTLARCRSR